jgi:tRNA(fMet)-specific endonuclease VapC
MKGRFALNEKIESIDSESLFVSEITLAELKFGVANSQHPAQNTKALNDFLSGIQLLPILEALDIYALEKARLRKEGKLVDDFDLLIGATAIANNMTLITNNTKHFERLAGIRIENWTI